MYFKTLAGITHNEEDLNYAEALLGHAHQLHTAATTIFPYKKYHKAVDARGHSYSSSGILKNVQRKGMHTDCCI